MKRSLWAFARYLRGGLRFGETRAMTPPNPFEAADAARRLEEADADIVEINPGPKNLKRGLPSVDHELSALVPVLKKLIPFVARPLSVVTSNAETARRAVDLGASIIHDPSGLAFDKNLAPTVNESKAGLILGHMRGDSRAVGSHGAPDKAFGHRPGRSAGFPDPSASGRH